MSRAFLLGLLLVSLWANAKPSILINHSGYLSQQDGSFYGDKDQRWQLRALGSSEVLAQLSTDEKGHGQLPKNLKPGWYQLSHGDTEVTLSVGLDGPLQTLKLLLNAYQYQHAGKALFDPVTGIRRPPAHLKPAVAAHQDSYTNKGQAWDASGGWYDAGDYGVYVATTAITAARLLEAANVLETSQLELAKQLRSEARVGLDWLLKMQRSDGAFYRKIGGANWPPLIPPHQDTQPRYLYGISTPDSAKAVAVLALASRVMDDTQAQSRYLRAAQLGWQYLNTQAQQKIDWHQGDDGGTGPYMFNQWDQQNSLTHDVDDRFWAASELFLSHPTDSLQRFLETHLPEQIVLFEWKDPRALGVQHLLQSGQLPKLNERLRQLLLERCNTLREHALKSPYSVANSRFIWGSNKMVAEQGILLAQCQRLAPQQDYLSWAWRQWHYLAGLNPFGIAYITGLGSNSVQNLHHIWGRAVGFVPAGMMVGGPNQDSQANIAPKGLGMLSYVDDAKDYSVNEFAIDYNGAAIGLLAELISQQSPIQEKAAAN